MTNKQADYVIANYKPYQGFFDLSVKPKELSKVEYAKILNVQNILAESNEKFKSVDKKLNQFAWDQAREVAAQLQQIIFQYWKGVL